MPTDPRGRSDPSAPPALGQNRVKDTPLRRGLDPASEQLAQDPEVEAVLEGRDGIALAPALTAAQGDKESTESLLVQVRGMTVAARVKLALRGNKEARQILTRDPVKLVQVCVLKNPRITLDEALAMSKNRSLHGELLRRISEESEWVRHYPLRLALVENPKTPLQISLSLLSGVRERDLRALARSKNVPSVLQQQARRNLARRSGA